MNFQDVDGFAYQQFITGTHNHREALPPVSIASKI